jgi:hypothetical protein
MFIKKVIRYLSRLMRICIQSVEKMLIRAKKIVFFKNSIWVSKNAEFYADYKSVEKVLDKCTKKVISKNVTEICNCFAYTFFFKKFKTFSTDVKYAIVLHIPFFKKNLKLFQRM